MLRLRHKLLIHAFRLSDQVILVGTLILLIAYVHERGSFRFLYDSFVAIHSGLNAVGAMMLLAGWALVFNYLVHYDANRFTSLATSLAGVVKATAAATFLLFIIDAALDISILSKVVIGLFWPVTCLLCITSRIVLRWLLMTLRKSGLNCRHLVFVGTNQRALDFAHRIEGSPELGYRIAGFIAENDRASDGDQAKVAGWPILDRVSGFKPFLEQREVDEVMVCLPLKEAFKDIYEITRLCRDLGVVVRIVPDLADIKTFAQSQVELFDGDCVVTFFREHLLWQLLVKRSMDLIVSFTLLVLLSPLLLIVAILIKSTSPGPVFFRQERIGMNKRKFKLLKFRSMIVDAEARKHELASLNEQEGPVFKIKNDPRVTPIGRWIRKTSIDELPQLFNVLKGEMSLVGPRPPLATEVDQYDWIYRRRLSIKPGITCLWQVSGRNNIPFAKWMELDRQYIENWSIWLDLKILLKTIPVVLLGKGAS